jgi:hypothetical protein
MNAMAMIIFMGLLPGLDAAIASLLDRRRTL